MYKVKYKTYRYKLCSNKKAAYLDIVVHAGVWFGPEGIYNSLLRAIPLLKIAIAQVTHTYCSLAMPPYFSVGGTHSHVSVASTGSTDAFSPTFSYLPAMFPIANMKDE